MDSSAAHDLKLIKTLSTPNGILINTYRRRES